MDANVPAQQISVQAVIMQNNSDISLSDQIRSSITEYAEHSKTNSVHHASIKNKVSFRILSIFILLLFIHKYFNLNLLFSTLSRNERLTYFISI